MFRLIYFEWAHLRADELSAREAGVSSVSDVIQRTARERESETESSRESLGSALDPNSRTKLQHVITLNPLHSRASKLIIRLVVVVRS